MGRMIRGLSDEQSRAVVGARLAELRTSLHLSQRDLAGEDCSYVTVSRIENGHSGLSEELAIAFAFRFGMEPSELWELLLHPVETEGFEPQPEATTVESTPAQGDAEESAVEAVIPDQGAEAGVSQEVALYRSLETCSDCDAPRSALPASHVNWVIRRRDKKPRCTSCYMRYLLGEPPVRGVVIELPLRESSG